MSLLAARREKAEKEKKDKSDKKDDEEVKAALKAGTWKEVKDANGKTYYYNPATKKTTWDLRKELKKQREAAAATAGGATSPPATTTTATAAATSSARPAVQETPKAEEPAKAQGAETAAATAQPTPQSTNIPTTPGITAGSTAINPTTGAISAGSAMASSMGLGGAQPVTDSMQQLLDENKQIRQLLASGSNGQVALDFQARYDAVLRNNQALQVQTERMKHEYDAMARALTEANKKIHELELQANSTTAGIKEKTKDEEIQLTLTHLREQNRALVTQISELSTLLARGLNENAVAAAGLRATSIPQATDSGATLFTRFLDSSARQVLCPTCTLSISQMRDRMLNPSESNVGSKLHHHVGGGAGGGLHNQQLGEDANPLYTQVSDITTPPPTFHYSAQPHVGNVNAPSGVGFGTPYQYSVAPSSGKPTGTPAGVTTTTTLPTSGGGGSQFGGAAPSGGQHLPQQHQPQETPGVMYNGFIIKNPRGM